VPIAFIHGVSTRQGAAYQREVALRRTMFTRAVIDVVKDRVPSLTLAPDVYWGDKGVHFDWDLASVPTTSTLEQLGADNGAASGAIDFPELIALSQLTHGPVLAPTGLEPLGPSEHSLAHAAQSDAKGVIEGVAVAERRRISRELDGPASGESAEKDGQRLAELLLATDDASRDSNLAAQVAGGRSDADIIERVTASIGEHYGRRHMPAGAVEGLGPDEWIRDRLRDLGNAVDAAIKIASNPAAGLARAATLAALQAQRIAQTRRWAFFFGDVFEYLRRGQDPDGIAVRVEATLSQAAAQASPADPLVVVAHSFGSEVVYDLLTSGRPPGIEVELWAMAGSQASLFAEMRMYRSSPPQPAASRPPALGRPAQVKRWLNVVDPADVLSYVAAPVFGKDAVEDVTFREWGNIATAHSGYFTEPAFYELLASRVRGEG
jgi:hypothetical protein